MLYAPDSGGVARYLREKRRWLARHTSVRHTLVVPAGHDGIGPGGEIFIRTRAMTRGPYRWPFAPLRWSREMQLRAPDLIEAGDAGAVGWSALHAAHCLGVPLVGFCHSDVVRMVDQRVGGLLAACVQRYAREFYRRCDVVIAPSEYMRRRLAQWGVDGAVVQPLGVDLATFTPAARDPGLRDALGLPRHTRMLVFAGRFAAEKNLDVLVRAFRRLGPRYRLVLIGNGHMPPEARAASNVIHVPYLQSARELAGWIASADGLVHAGDQETFGLILLEAMACGRGVVAAAAGAAPEVVGADCGVLVPPRDAAALADGIEAFYAANIEALGANARRRVEQRYSWDAAMKGLLSVYRGAVVRSPAPTTRYVPS